MYERIINSRGVLSIGNQKQRTREHIIADLSVNYVERFALLCGYTIEPFRKDYGYDLNLYTYSESGEIENGNIYLQLKATDHLPLVSHGQAISFPLNKKDLQPWLEEPLPAIFILYDASKNCAYWLYLQAYFEVMPDFDINAVNQSYTINIPIENQVDMVSMKQFAQFKEDVLEQIHQQRIHHAI